MSDTTLTGRAAAEGLYHLLKPRADVRDADGNPVDVVVLHAGNRYGGFRDEAHAGFFVRHRRMEGAEIAFVPRGDGHE